MTRWLALCALIGCGGGGTAGADADPHAPDADPHQPDADPHRPDADPSAPDGAGPGAPDAGSPLPVVAACWPTCTSASDCVTAGELFGADNYQCDDGICRWTGCNSTAECTATYGSPSWECATFPDATFPSCYPTCGSAADCASPGELFGVDNYACDGGKCRWTGCNSTAECTATYMSPDYVCDEIAGTSIDTCWPTCASAADCVTTGELFGVDNYECDGGKCRWTGCNSAAECTSTFMEIDYTCR